MLGSNRPYPRVTRNLAAIAILLFLAAGLVATGLLIPVQAAPPAQDAAPRSGSMMENNMMGHGMLNNGPSMAQMGTMMDQMMAQMHGMMGTMSMTGTMPMGTIPMMGMMPMCASMPMDGTMSMTNTMSMTGTMPMMGAMPMPGMMPMTDTMPMMGMMPMSGTMPGMSMVPMTDTIQLAHAGMMMQMMGMMQMHMGCMQMMMGAMMSGNMMSGSMLGEGMGRQNVGANTTPAAPEATATVETTATTGVSESAASSEPEAEAHDSGHPAPSLAGTPQRATAGAVTIEAVPLSGEELLDIAFAITLETHSVELDFDLAELATLTIGEASFPATEWTPDAPSGHHVAGTLRFTIDHPAHAKLAEVNEVTLELRDIDGQQATLRFAVSE